MSSKTSAWGFESLLHIGDHDAGKTEAHEASTRLSSEANGAPPKEHSGVQKVLDTMAAAQKEVEHQEVLFGEGVVTGLILNPVNGVRQLINHVADTDIKPIEFSNQKEVNSSLAGQLGCGTGLVIGCLATDGLLTGAGMGAEAAAVATGVAQGGIFTPGKENCSDTDFITDRCTKGVIGGITGGTIGGVAGAVKKFVIEKTELAAQPITSKIVTDVASGHAGGIVQAEATAILYHGRLATPAELQQAADNSAAQCLIRPGGGKCPSRIA